MTIICKAWKSPAEYPSSEYKHDIKAPEDNMLNPIFKESASRFGNIQGVAHLQSKYYLVTESLKV